LNIFVHDYAGHPFQVGLSRTLARRGYRTTHAFFAGDQGPKGDFVNHPDDADKLSFVPIMISGNYDKASFVSRRFKDVEYGRSVAARIRAIQPDIVISGNTPTEAQTSILKAAHKVGAAFVYWVQDFYSIAASRLLTKKFGFLGSLVGAYYRKLDRSHFRQSNAIVLITEDFLSTAAAWVDDSDKIFVIENWGAADEIKPIPRSNTWAESNGLEDVFTFLYSGTLALKHNPDFLIALARQWRHRSNVKIVVAAHGVGVDHLRAAIEAETLNNLILLPLQPFNMIPNVLAAADVLVAIIEQDAGIFSVPSKVQSYLCAKRPILLAAPKKNLASRILLREAAGLVVAPGDIGGFLDAAAKLYEDSVLRAQMAERGHAYASRTYNIEAVTNRFIDVFNCVRPVWKPLAT
jgi:colanic acid biosynthesis glycosyl transferase WcaI